jgi:hypothetical protein
VFASLLVVAACGSGFGCRAERPDKAGGGKPVVFDRALGDGDAAPGGAGDRCRSGIGLSARASVNQPRSSPISASSAWACSPIACSTSGGWCSCGCRRVCWICRASASMPRCLPARRNAVAMRVRGSLAADVGVSAIASTARALRPARLGSGGRPPRVPRYDPGPLPAAEQGVHRLPGAIAVRHIPPRRTHPHPPPDPINELPFRPLRRPTRLRGHGQQRCQPRPLLIGQVEPTRHR